MANYRYTKNGKIRFDNCYGASVVSQWGSYGYEEGLYELAVLQFRDGSDDYDLVYDTDITDDVIGYLGGNDVEFILGAISRLDKNGKLPEGDPYFDWTLTGE